MTKFRKLPVVIDAVQITAADFNGQTWDGSPFAEVAPEWLVDAVKGGLVAVHPGSEDYAWFAIKTLEGTMIAGPGDWIIQGIKGEIYPCKPDIFAATYELVQ